MTDPLLLLIDMLAVFRFSRLIVADSIFDTPRSWLLARWPGDETVFGTTPTAEPPPYVHAVTGIELIWVDGTWMAARPRWFGKWLSCIWCVSPYVAAAVVMARSWWDWWQYPALVAALSAVAGIIHVRTSE